MDIHRPAYHFLPPANWMNDPNGLIQWDGTYHLYYQYNPTKPEWGWIHWGHASSPDLVHWTHHPVALAPSQSGPDRDGCFSGCAVRAGERAAFLYTGVVEESAGNFRQSACLAWGEGDLTQLVQDQANPVIAEPPSGGRRTGFRDHIVWMQPDGWRMAIGSGLEESGGEVLMYASVDLRHWQALGTLCAAADLPPTDFAMGNMWECPSFFQSSGRAGLIISSCGAEGYGPTFIGGHYADPRLIPERVDKLDWGGRVFYAPQVFSDERSRLLMFGWLAEERPVSEQVAAGWSGVMSLPRVLRIDPQGALLQSFAPELTALRGEVVRFEDLVVGETGQDLGVRTRQAEILLTLERQVGGSGGLSLLRSPDGQFEIRLEVDWAAEKIRLLRSRSGSRTPLGDLEASLSDLNGPLRIRLFLDGSTFELIANDRLSLSARVYPPHAHCDGMRLYGQGGDLHVRNLQVYPLPSIW